MESAIFKVIGAQRSQVSILWAWFNVAICSPLWLSPRQSIVVPVGLMFEDYARKVSEAIYNAGFICDMDVDQGDTMNKKIRNAQVAQYNFIFVVGEREKSSNTVNVRTRDNIVHGEFPVSEVIEKFKILKQQRLPDSANVF